MNSRTYQASARPNDTNAEDENETARMCWVRSLPAESLLDAIAQVTQTKLTFTGFPRRETGPVSSLGYPQLQRGRIAARNIFVSCALSANPNACSTATLRTLRQHHAGPGPAVDHWRHHQQGHRRSRQLPGDFFSRKANRNSAIIDELFLASLCRLPTSAERDALVRRVEMAGESGGRLSKDVLWGLLNSKEFSIAKVG